MITHDSSMQARHAFYGSLLMGLLAHHIASASADAEGVGKAKGEVRRIHNHRLAGTDVPPTLNIWS